MSLKLYSPQGSDLSPWREFETLSNRLGRLFEEGNNPSNAWVPAVNVEETADHIVLTAEAPGLTLEDLNVEIENNILTISGEKREEREEGHDNRRYHLWERRYGSFRRSFTLPRTVDSDSVEARFDNGILTIQMPKAAEAKSRKIEVKS